jgi:uncharacterized RDD family membrane protein YckC
MDYSDDSGGVSYELASIGNRFVARLIDDLMVLIATVVAGLFILPIGGESMLTVTSIGISVAYYWYFWTRKDGQTPGKSMMKIKVIKTDGTPLNDGDALLRVFGYYVGQFSLGLGYLWAVFDQNNQGWHDKMANTFVVVTEQEKKKFVRI